MENREYSFKRGWSQRRMIDAEEMKAKLMAACNVTTDVSFNNRMYGYIIPKADEYKAIEKVFAEYGITEVWGSSETEVRNINV